MNAAIELALEASYANQRWYAAYACANHEKRVAVELEARSVEYFLPLYSSIRRWRDRRVRLDLPLFPGYIFVQLPLRDKLRVLEISSVVRLVGFNGQPIALSDGEIEALRRGLTEQSRADPHPYLTVGRQVRIIGGPFTGLQGVLLRKRNIVRVVVSLDLIERSVAVEVDGADIQPIPPSKRH